MSIIIAKTFWVTELDSDLQHNVWFWTYTFSIFFYWSSQVIISRTAKVVFTAYSQAQYSVAVAFSVEIMLIGCTSKNTRLSDTCVLCITVWFSLHYHLLRSLFRWEQNIHMHWIHGRQVSFCLFLFLIPSRVPAVGETSGTFPLVSWLCIHLHVCRSKARLTAVSCLACLCAKSYKVVINLDLSAVVAWYVWDRLEVLDLFVKGCVNVLTQSVKS